MDTIHSIAKKKKYLYGTTVFLMKKKEEESDKERQEGDRKVDSHQWMRDRRKVPCKRV